MAEFSIIRNKSWEFNSRYFLLLPLTVVIFIFLSALKIVCIEHFILNSTFNIFMPGHRIFLAKKLILYLLFGELCFFALTFPKRPIFLLSLYVFQTIYLFTHFAYFLYFGRLFHSFLFATNILESTHLVKYSLIPCDLKYLIIFIDLPFFAFVIFKYKALKDFMKRSHKILKWVKVISCSVLVVGILFSYKHWGIRQLLRNQYEPESAVIKNIGLLGSDLIDLIFYRSEKTLIDGFDYGRRLVYKKESVRKIKNIICIQVESLDADIINYKYKEKYVAPFMYQLSKECIYYPYVFFYYFAGCTSDTEFEVINGTRPLSNFPPFKLRNYAYPNSIAKRFSKAGFCSLAFHNNHSSFFNRKTAYIKMGFQDFYDITKMDLIEKGWGAEDRDMLDYVKNMLKHQTQPFFYYIITMSSHEPFKNVSLYYNDHIYDAIDDEVTKGYFNSISYVDGALQDFISFVKETKKDTYIFIFGDHSIGVPPASQNRSYVPLFIITPDDLRYVAEDRIASVLDLGRTVLYAAGIDFEIMTSGFNLLDVPISRQLKNRFNLPVFIAHAGAEAQGVAGTNSVEALNSSYDKGFRFIELDFEWTSDYHLVLIHDWQHAVSRLFNMPPRCYDYDEFRRFRMIGGLTQMTMDNLEIWLERHPDVFIITDVKKDNIATLKYISKNYKGVKKQLIPQVYNFDEYNEARKMGFRFLILTLYASNYSDYEILDFLQKNYVLAVTMPIDRAMTDLPSELKKEGIFVYAHTVNEQDLANSLRSNGVGGFYTDSLVKKH
jgi:lipoteichoic acid synthase